jgi:hypothetical protein
VLCKRVEFQVERELELGFAHYSSRSEFLGLKSLILDNFTTDPSMIRSGWR